MAKAKTQKTEEEVMEQNANIDIDVKSVAEEVEMKPPEKFLTTGAVSCSLTVAIHYIENGVNPADVKVLTKEFRGKNFVDIIKILDGGVRRLVEKIKPDGGYLIKIHPRKFTVDGFTDASGIYQNERAMSALSGVLYLIMFGSRGSR